MHRSGKITTGMLRYILASLEAILVLLELSLRLRTGEVPVIAKPLSESTCLNRGKFWPWL